MASEFDRWQGCKHSLSFAANGEDTYALKESGRILNFACDNRTIVASNNHEVVVLKGEEVVARLHPIAKPDDPEALEKLRETCWACEQHTSGAGL